MNHQHIPSAPRMEAVMDSCGDYEKPHRFVQRVFAAGKAIEIENAALTARITELEERNGALEEKCTLFAASLNKADDRIAELGAALTDMEQRKDGAYLERNQVVAALAKAHSSGKARTAIEGWSEDWHGCVYIDLPTGQASWHYHDSHAYLFVGIPHYLGAWDGHTTDEKYARLAALAAIQPAAPQEPVAWIDQFGNTFPLSAYSVDGKPNWSNEHKRGWKKLFTAPTAPDAAAVRDGWVNVADRLPDAPGSYLLALSPGAHGLVTDRAIEGQYRQLHSIWTVRDCAVAVSVTGHVTHWMPLPASPAAVRAMGE